MRAASDGDDAPGAIEACQGVGQCARLRGHRDEDDVEIVGEQSQGITLAPVRRVGHAMAELAAPDGDDLGHDAVELPLETRDGEQLGPLRGDGIGDQLDDADVPSTPRTAADRSSTHRFLPPCS